jgi:hypothetical protein
MNSVFHNYDLAGLADQLGEVKAARRGLELRERQLQQELERRGVVSLVGHEYRVQRSKFERLDPDRDKLRARLGIAVYEAEFCKAVPVVRWTCTAIETDAGGQRRAA